MSLNLVIVGCGGFGREVLEIVSAINQRAPTWHVAGVLDDDPRDEELALLDARNVGHLGDVSALAGMSRAMYAVLGIGSPAARRSISAQHPNQLWATLVHPDTTIGLDVNLGAGTVVAAGSRLSTHINVGAHVQIDQGVTVGHDTQLHDFSRLNPQACISGNVDIRAGAYVGANATVLQGLSVGMDTVIGAGAVVTKDVIARTTVKGVPAR